MNPHVALTISCTDLGGLFDRLDNDHNGHIDLAELAHLSKRLLPNITATELSNLMKKADVDGYYSFLKYKCILEYQQNPHFDMQERCD